MEVNQWWDHLPEADREVVLRRLYRRLGSGKKPDHDWNYLYPSEVKGKIRSYYQLYVLTGREWTG